MHERRWHDTGILGALGAAAIAFGGCGGSSATSGSDSSATAPAAAQATTRSTTTQSTARTPSESGPLIDLHISSPVGTKLPARYTCDGQDISLPLTWGSVPRGTLEIDLFIVRYEPSSEQEKPAWGVAGIKPTTRSIPAGQLPAGAIVGRNEFGQDRYSVCPAHGTTAEYIVVLDALPRKLPVQPGFATEAVLSRAVHSANHEGELNLTYHRP